MVFTQLYRILAEESGVGFVSTRRRSVRKNFQKTLNSKDLSNKILLFEIQNVLKNMKQTIMKKILFTSLMAIGMVWGVQAQALKVDASGNVGVNKASPTEKLDVNGNVIIPNNQYYMSFRSDGSTFQQVFGMDPNNDIVFNRSAINANQTSALIFGSAHRFIDFRDEDNGVLMRVRASDGRVGIGTNSPSHNLTLASGDAAKPGGGEWAATSDRRAKKSVRPFEDGLKEILQIDPVFFQYNGKFGTDDSQKEYVGVVAQSMKQIAPYTVTEKEYVDITTTYSNARGTEETVNSRDKYLTFDGTAIQYMLVNAIKEQNKMLEDQKDRISNLEAEINELKDIVSGSGLNDINVKDQIQNVTIQGSDRAFLDQNRPNPFAQITKVQYSIPENAEFSELRIYDFNGRAIKKVPISHRGVGQIDLEFDEMPRGSYTYTLFIDGKPIESKKLTLQ